MKGGSLGAALPGDANITDFFFFPAVSLDSTDCFRPPSAPPPFAPKAFAVEATVHLAGEEEASLIDASDLIAAVQSLPDHEVAASSGKRRGLGGTAGKRHLDDDAATTAAATVTQSWEVYFEMGAGQEAEAVAGTLHERAKLRRGQAPSAMPIIGWARAPAAPCAARAPLRGGGAQKSSACR